MAHVWIDRDECLGAGTCEQIAPDVFTERSDGTWAVKEEQAHFGVTTVFDGSGNPGTGPDGVAGRARIPEAIVDLVVEAAEECPAECVYVEL